jgi:dihydrodipicolinate synthase/N-acetylneuraminate lyase
MITGQALRGITIPIVTPVTADQSVDHDGLRRVVRHVLDGGVHTVFALGGTGNFCSFTSAERAAVTRTVAAEIRRRVPLMVGCMDSNTRLVVRNVEAAAEAGADVVVVEPPYYYPCTTEDVIEHFRTVAAASPVPILIYNIPAANKVNIDLNLTRRLAEIPGIIGIKDSTSDFVYWQQLIGAFAGSDFALIQGQETLAGPSLLSGGHGAILAIGNVVPRLCVQLYAAAVARNLADVTRLQGELMRAFRIVERHEEGGPAGQYYGVTVASFFAGLEAALHTLKLCDRVTTSPFARPSGVTVQRVRAILTALGSHAVPASAA